MGSHTFRQTVGGKQMMPRDAYATLVQRARDEYGDNSYNGTIATTSGFVMVDAGRRRIDTVINEILKDESSNIQKWGPAGCIELKGTKLTEWRKRNGLAGTRARAYAFFGWAAS
jgi:hypothetical protein